MIFYINEYKKSKVYFFYFIREVIKIKIKWGLMNIKGVIL